MEFETLVIFDLGAYIGEVTAKYRMLFPKATIFSFEPSPESFRRVEERFKGDKMVKPFQLAFANKASKGKFYIYTDKSCNSLFLRVGNLNGLEKEVEVDVSTIDDFTKKWSISRINILKLDVEGAELMILKGASQKLAQKLVDLIYTEVMFIPHYKGGVMFYELCSFLSDYGYMLFSLYDIKRAENGQLRWGNAIFISPYLRKSIDNADK